MGEAVHLGQLALTFFYKLQTLYLIGHLKFTSPPFVVLLMFPLRHELIEKKSINIEKSKLIFHLLLNLDLRKTNSFPEKVSLL